MMLETRVIDMTIFIANKSTRQDDVSLLIIHEIQYVRVENKFAF